nr:septal ring lytic transglycosylase RlpA family protein [Ottowia thiooxydans]
MRCSNYSGFKGRLSLRAETRSTSAAPEEALVGSAVRLGRDLQSGIASWYGPGFHGRKTANGERFDMGEMTAAHKTLPFGTRVLVHNPRNGKQVVVRINDRGPYARGRVIDLSGAAASALGIKARGHDAVVLKEVQETGNGDLVASSTASASSD